MVEVECHFIPYFTVSLIEDERQFMIECVSRFIPHMTGQKNFYIVSG